MRRTFPILLTAALALGAVAAGDTPPELADHPCYDAETEALAYTEQQVFFHEGDSKLGNDSAATWDTEAPTDSVQAGAGAGALSSSAALADTAGDEARTEATFTGTFDGCIDTVLFDVYSFDPLNRTGTSASAEPANHNFRLSITVDGEEMFVGGPLEANSTLANEGMGPNLNQFAVDLGARIEQFASFIDTIDIDGSHEITVTIASWFANTGHSAYLWDTTEVPSGMTFNGTLTEAHPVVG